MTGPSPLRMGRNGYRPLLQRWRISLGVCAGCAFTPVCFGAPVVPDSTRQTYVAPIEYGGIAAGTSTITYWLQPNPHSVPQQPEMLVCWTCTFDSTINSTFGGTLLVELADTRGDHDWVIGETKISVGPRATASVADTASVLLSTAARLGAPHWHVICHGYDMPFRCGPVKKVSG